MNIFDFAMQMERDGENFYRELAGKTQTAGMKQIFTLLAGDEAKHYQIFEAMKSTAGVAMAETTILSDSKNVFQEIKDAGGTVTADASESDLYRQALEIERKGKAFYEEKAGEVDNDEQKKLFMDIAEEEGRHIFLLENMIDFLERPASWVEDAEFNHLEDY